MEMGYAVAEESSPAKKVKKNKPGFLSRWLFGKLQTAALYEQNQRNESMKVPARIGIDRGEPSIDQPERAIQFTVYTANGGRVIETRRYDRQKDRHTNSLYVITGEQDFGREIDKIVTIEGLRG